MNLSKNALSEKIFESLRDRIVHMEYPPGTALSEKDLCEEFGVSRTPLREAIRRLEDMKLVNALPRYGTYVTPLDIHEIRCAFEVKNQAGRAGRSPGRQTHHAGQTRCASRTHRERRSSPGRR